MEKIAKKKQLSAFKHVGFWKCMDTPRDREFLEKYKNKKITVELKVLNKFYKNKKVFITGHTGFKGIWLLLILKFLGAKVKGYSLQLSKE
jgi:NDP-sugar pyrophosphorylase family protein